MPPRAILALTSVFGLGYLPRAPGTWGTLAALPIWWALRVSPPWAMLLAALGVTALGIWASSRAEAIYGGHDVQHIVIDEVAGMLFTVVGVPFTWPIVVLAFALFRLLDALKPGPIGAIDARVGGGLGVMLDDVAAGLIACAALHVAAYAAGGWSPWQ